MKDSELAVITILKADTSVKAAVGTRIYRGEEIPENPTKPFIAVESLTKVPESPTSSSTYRTDRIQCTSVDTNVTTLTGAGVRVAALSDLIGAALAPEQIENTIVNGIEISEVDDRGSMPDNSDAKTTKECRDSHDFMITYRLR
jgi:hypothetical protein